MFQIDFIAVLVAAVASFAVGALWYSPFAFLPAWAKANGVDPTAMGGNPAVTFGTAFVLTLVSALALAVLAGPNPSLTNAAALGAVLGACVAASSLSINHLFAGRAMVVSLIDGGFHTVRFALMGVVLALLS